MSCLQKCKQLIFLSKNLKTSGKIGTIKRLMKYCCYNGYKIVKLKRAIGLKK